MWPEPAKKRFSAALATPVTMVLTAGGSRRVAIPATTAARTPPSPLPWSRLQLLHQPHKWELARVQDPEVGQRCVPSTQFAPPSPVITTLRATPIPVVSVPASGAR